MLRFHERCFCRQFKQRTKGYDFLCSEYIRDTEVPSLTLCWSSKGHKFGKKYFE